MPAHVLLGPPWTGKAEASPDEGTSRLMDARDPVFRSLRHVQEKAFDSFCAARRQACRHLNYLADGVVSTRALEGTELMWVSVTQ